MVNQNTRRGVVQNIYHQAKMSLLAINNGLAITNLVTGSIKIAVPRIVNTNKQHA